MAGRKYVNQRFSKSICSAASREAGRVVQGCMDGVRQIGCAVQSTGQFPDRNRCKAWRLRCDKETDHTLRKDLASNNGMIYTEYGKTGAQVSAVGFGGMRFDESKSNEENAELLLHARSKGINYFDTAPEYCSDTSEDIFGIALKQMADSRSHYYVSTKGMPTSFDTADKAGGRLRNQSNA